MAYWAPKKPKPTDRYVFIYTRRDGKLKKVTPRTEYAYLDAYLHDPTKHHLIDQHVSEWSLKNEEHRSPVDKILFSDDTLNKECDRFLDWLKGSQKKLAEGTVDKYKRCLRKYAFPYFLSHGLKEPHLWHGVSVGLLAHLQEHKDISSGYIRDINHCLEKFYGWMIDEGVILGTAAALRLRNPPSDEDEDETPLDYTIDPAEVYAFVEKVERWEIKLLALLGYFFSLRPQESFGIRRGDFEAGPKSLSHESAQAMLSTVGFGRLSAHVHRQRDKKGNTKPPKAYSKGWVSCFEGRAAQMVVEILRRFEPTEDIFTVGNDRLFELWRHARAKTDLKETTLKDLRRASIYYLGHTTKFSGAGILLMKHARHKEFKTTELYLRRPTEQVTVNTDDLDIGA